MLNRLISLVFLLTILNINVVYSESKFLLPQKKPSIFKETEKEIKKNIIKNLPVPKPILPKEPKTSQESVKKEKVETTKKKKTTSATFIFPKKKTSHIKELHV